MKKLYQSQLAFILLIGSFFLVPSSVIAGESKNSKLETATFAGGCFWCMESPYEKMDGVHSVVSGYIGGHVKNPTYKQVSSGKSGHVEAVEIKYNPKKISYNDLLEILWRNIDPTDAGGQFVDRGGQYASGIYYHNKTQKKLAEKSKARLGKSKRFKKPIVSFIVKATKFYPAEDYHQDYYKVNPVRYKYYRYRSGRDEFIDKSWGKDRDYKVGKNGSAKQGKYTRPSKSEIKKKLTKLQYKVTQQDGTEPSFDNKYWDNKKPGIYIDIVSGEPLFSSTDKFKSGTGWPSFTKPLEKEHVVEIEDSSLFMKRVAVNSKVANSHLGHVFDDGPAPTGLRYCINSASLEFVPVEQLKQRGFGQYLKLFKKK